MALFIKGLKINITSLTISTIDEWLDENGRWWLDEFYNMSDDDKKSFILRYRLTIATCLNSDSYDEEALKEEIEEYWEYEMV